MMLEQDEFTCMAGSIKRGAKQLTELQNQTSAFCGHCSHHLVEQTFASVVNHASKKHFG